jgi:hypothetical protein
MAMKILGSREAAEEVTIHHHANIARVSMAVRILRHSHFQRREVARTECPTCG